MRTERQILVQFEEFLYIGPFGLELFPEYLVLLLEDLVLLSQRLVLFLELPDPLLQITVPV